LCEQRANFPANADIWHLRFHWHALRRELLQTLNRQDYTFLPISLVTNADGETLHLWSSQDALVLKMLAMSLRAALASGYQKKIHHRGHKKHREKNHAISNIIPFVYFVVRNFFDAWLQGNGFGYK
jgi:RNA-directed DNA polymerase